MLAKQHALWLLPAIAFLLSVITVYISLQGVTHTKTELHAINTGAGPGSHSPKIPSLPRQDLTVKTITIWYISDGISHDSL